MPEAGRPPDGSSGDSEATEPIDRWLPGHWVRDGGVLLQGGVLLSSRETDVLDAIGEGLSNVEIARRLSLSDSTVRHYVSALRQKLTLNRVQLGILWDHLRRDNGRSP